MKKDAQGCEAFNGEWVFCAVSTFGGWVWESTEAFTYNGESVRLYVTSTSSVTGPFFLGYGPSMFAITGLYSWFGDWDTSNFRQVFTKFNEEVCPGLPYAVSLGPALLTARRTEDDNYRITEDGNYRTTEDSY